MIIFWPIKNALQFITNYIKYFNGFGSETFTTVPLIDQIDETIFDESTADIVFPLRKFLPKQSFRHVPNKF